MILITVMMKLVAHGRETGGENGNFWSGLIKAILCKSFFVLKYLTVTIVVFLSLFSSLKYGY